MPLGIVLVRTCTTNLDGHHILEYSAQLDIATCHLVLLNGQREQSSYNGKEGAEEP